MEYFGFLFKIWEIGIWFHILLSHRVILEKSVSLGFRIFISEK